MKTCKKCLTEKALEDFRSTFSKARGKTYIKNQCRSCEAEYSKTWHKEQGRDYDLKYKYGITSDQYESMLAAQNGKCANPACEATEPGRGNKYFCVDHDHSCCPTEKTCGECVRGLLCHSCNVILGHAKDSIAVLEGLSVYLLKDVDVLKEVTL